MLNINQLFIGFDEKVSLSKTKKDDLKRGRDTLRGKIKDYFKEEKGMKVPSCCGQGSFMMKTVVDITGDKEYDIDDGIYLNHYIGIDQAEWPSTQTVHNWIKKAVEGHTNQAPIDKNTCIRVVYAGNYHIDLPSYIIKDEVAYLAHKTKGWIESDPKAITAWFREKNSGTNDQLRRVVKYIKAWKDYQNKDSKEVDICGLAITILVGKHFYMHEGRDDNALLGTLTNIIEELEDEFKCKKPVNPKNEDLFEGFSEDRKNKIIKKLKSLKNTIEAAIGKEKETDAAELLKGEFGTRFPKGEDKNNNLTSESFIITKAPDIIKTDGKSA